MQSRYQIDADFVSCSVQGKFGHGLKIKNALALVVGRPG